MYVHGLWEKECIFLVQKGYKSKYMEQKLNSVVQK